MEGGRGLLPATQVKRTKKPTPKKKGGSLVHSFTFPNSLFVRDYSLILLQCSCTRMTWIWHQPISINLRILDTLNWKVHPQNMNACKHEHEHLNFEGFPDFQIPDHFQKVFFVNLTQPVGIKWLEIPLSPHFQTKTPTLKLQHCQSFSWGNSRW